MALRSEPAVTVPITGPRSRALAAPQWIGKRLGVPAPGWEVSRIWPVRLMVMAPCPKANRPLADACRTKGLKTKDNVVLNGPAGKGETGRKRGVRSEVWPGAWAGRAADRRARDGADSGP